MNHKLVLMGRAAVAGLLLAASLTALGAGPGVAAETYSFDTKAWTFDYQPTFSDLTAARIAKVGITPIPIP
ncbi:MAG TPA: hypothetical protein VHF27_12055 [Acidimicrobiales bacterium]|nr:hypothetical protein [Acidimicrobiales bacterium]